MYPALRSAAGRTVNLRQAGPAAFDLIGVCVATLPIH
jgi:hypothetical protein